MDLMSQLYAQPFAGMDAQASNKNLPPYLPNFSLNTQPQAPPSGIADRQSSVLQFLPVSGLLQEPAQSELQMVTYRESLNPTQRNLSSSPLEEESPSQKKKTSKTTGKRPRSPKSVEAQQRTTFRHQLSKNKNVPGSCLGVFFVNAETVPKRNRTPGQKKHKREVEEDGGACFLCRMTKTRVITFLIPIESLLTAANIIGSALLNVLAILAKSYTK
jgi:hypothetical protein